MAEMLLTCIEPTANIIGDAENPNTITNKDSQLLFGEKFEVTEEHGAYVYGQGIHDSYKGFVERVNLAKNIPNPNAVVKIRATHIYDEPDFKTRPDTYLPFLSRVTITEDHENGFIALDGGGWIFSDHLTALDDFKMPDDIAQTATMFLGTPYLYGGRSTFGIDCSGLVQQVLMAHGHKDIPRDSGDQQKSFGKETSEDNLQRNDIVFFDGHVGIMMDEKFILNATARHMTTVIEDIAELKKAYGDTKFIARLQ